MVRAILAGTKTQTRRVVKPQPTGFIGGPGVQMPDGTPAPFVPMDDTVPPFGREILCPYGQPGDRLWVRETFRIGEDLGAGWEPWMSAGDRFVAYDSPAADEYCVPGNYVIPRNAKEVHNSEGTDEHWRSFGPIPSIHMPRWASRITLEVTAVRVERLQAISRGDALAEGIVATHGGYGLPDGSHFHATDPRVSYWSLWDAINGPGSVEANPWVWAGSFRRLP